MYLALPHRVAVKKEKVDRKLPKGLGEKKLRLLGTSEERERLHCYLSEQMVAQSSPWVTNRCGWVHPSPVLTGYHQSSLVFQEPQN